MIIKCPLCKDSYEDPNYVPLDIAKEAAQLAVAAERGRIERDIAAIPSWEINQIGRYGCGSGKVKCIKLSKALAAVRGTGKDGGLESTPASDGRCKSCGGNGRENGKLLSRTCPGCGGTGNANRQWTKYGTGKDGE